MRVVRESIRNKIDKGIDKNCKDILRIELTDSEFEDFIYSITGKETSTREITKDLVGGYSGSYVVYRNVCVQTHHSYTE